MLPGNLWVIAVTATAVAATAMEDRESHDSVPDGTPFHITSQRKDGYVPKYNRVWAGNAAAVTGYIANRFLVWPLLCEDRFTDSLRFGATWFLSEGTLNLYTLQNTTQHVYVDHVRSTQRDQVNETWQNDFVPLEYTIEPRENYYLPPAEHMTRGGWSIVGTKTPKIKFEGKDLFYCTRKLKEGSPKDKIAYYLAVPRRGGEDENDTTALERKHPCRRRELFVRTEERPIRCTYAMLHVGP